MNPAPSNCSKFAKFSIVKMNEIELNKKEGAG